MANPNDKTGQLLEKLDLLLKKQEAFSREINNLRNEIYKLKVAESEKPAGRVDTNTEIPKEIVNDDPGYQRQPSFPDFQKTSAFRSGLEKFIGENLFSKIGIIITVIGVAIGAKYAIDHELISPLTRIILGYLVGTGLLGFAIRLKKNYENFSAVLLSGAMAVMYFITYAAYSFYNLIPQVFAFILMVIFTIFT
ncbi:MAG: DUF2339 domain-containing protein, partial [Syntrophothermus sp.]